MAKKPCAKEAIKAQPPPHIPTDADARVWMARNEAVPVQSAEANGLVAGRVCSLEPFRCWVWGMRVTGQRMLWALPVTNSADGPGQGNSLREL